MQGACYQSSFQAVTQYYSGVNERKTSGNNQSYLGSGKAWLEKV